MQIEQAAFTLAWPESVYRRELTSNSFACYLAVRPRTNPRGTVLAYGGLWLMGDEAHIATLATEPRLRRQGLGEFILQKLLERGRRQGSRVVTLEVRPSNHSARRLYAKYRFAEAGRRARYYSDTGEDAIILTTPALIDPAYQVHLAGLRERLYPRLAKIRLDKSAIVD
jgi:[ribosomal protein S18]-alanine N-acetyltransferase